MFLRLKHSISGNWSNTALSATVSSLYRAYASSHVSVIAEGFDAPSGRPPSDRSLSSLGWFFMFSPITLVDVRNTAPLPPQEERPRTTPYREVEVSSPGRLFCLWLPSTPSPWECA